MRILWKILDSLFYLMFLAIIVIALYFLLDVEWFEILGMKFFVSLSFILTGLFLIDNWLRMLNE